jgi:hypothetical protein
MLQWCWVGALGCEAHGLVTGHGQVMQSRLLGSGVWEFGFRNLSLSLSLFLSLSLSVLHLQLEGAVAMAQNRAVGLG